MAVDLLDRGAQLEPVESGLQEVRPIDGQIGFQSEGSEDGPFPARLMHRGLQGALDHSRPAHGENVIEPGQLGPNLDAPTGVTLDHQSGQGGGKARGLLDVAEGVQRGGQNGPASRVALPLGGDHVHPVGRLGHRGDRLAEADVVADLGGDAFGQAAAADVDAGQGREEGAGGIVVEARDLPEVHQGRKLLGQGSGQGVGRLEEDRRWPAWG